MSGRSYFFVVDGFGDFDFGAYTATISSADGFFQVASVPDGGSTFALASLAFGSVLIAGRRLRLRGTVACR